jgi:hypothetical protein
VGRVAELGSLGRCIRMNKPVAFICACISAFGVLILGVSIYHSVVYGSMEAGVFTRHVYWTKRDTLTGELQHDYAELPTAKVTPLSGVDTWVAGTVFFMGGIAIYVFEWSCRDRRTA